MRLMYLLTDGIRAAWHNWVDGLRRERDMNYYYRDRRDRWGVSYARRR